ncbi:uncharacterized protein LOC115921202 [Strongylocentrotus purpuratus]|uniref:Uncharacterized protein n=1 Tax=Strongylocentrotus purpuratus TaxID=7668 RepID=A0A7M7NBV1_STRPU|nr:uncharacterized protein LOC115921202 [Strongylocentrotus purpuratus]
MPSLISNQLEQIYRGTSMPEDERRQPFVLLLGERSRPAQAFVIFEGRAMAAPSLLKAIDLCFKMIYVFDVEYAPQCYTTWEFVQKYVFEISDNVKGKMGTSHLSVA